MPSIQILLRSARDELAQAGIDDPMIDARLLLMEAGGFSRTDLITRGPEKIAASIADIYAGYIKRRIAREPVAYILGRKEFWSLEFSVSKDVLVPRPETEGVVEQALCLMTGNDNAQILDIGTGSGAILVSLLSELENAIGFGVDISENALDMARKNAEILNVDDRSAFEKSNFLESVTGRYDLIVSNPPYIDAPHMRALPKTVKDYEPNLALAGGEDGLYAYEIIIKDLPRVLKPNGHVVFEIGYDQAAPVSALLAKNGFTEIKCTQDLAGHDRVISAKISE